MSIFGEEADTGAFSCPVWRNTHLDLQLDFEHQDQISGCCGLSKLVLFVSMSTGLFWQLPGACMLGQVIPVGTRTSASSLNISSAHLSSVQFWPTSPFPIRDSCRVNVERLVWAGTTASTAYMVKPECARFHITFSCSAVHKLYLRDPVSPEATARMLASDHQSGQSCLTADPYPEPAELPSECPYGKEIPTTASKNPY